MSLLLTLSNPQPGMFSEGDTHRVEPFIEAATGPAIETLTRNARRWNPAYIPPDYSRFRVLRLGSRALLSGPVSGVESVEPDAPLGPPPAIPNDPGFPTQTYLLPPGRNEGQHSSGIGAVCAWTFPGGDGTGVGAVVFDQCQPLDPDLPDFPADRFILGIPCVNSSHSTQVLGVLAARRDNAQGCVGIAYNASYRFASPWRSLPPAVPTVSSITNDVIRVAAAMNPGDILLLQLQNAAHLPFAIYQEFRTAIGHIGASGITIIETAGNGKVDLDTRIPPDAEYSSILVAASTVANRKLESSNYGHRIQCFALGEFVQTLPYSQGPGSFNSTSSAAAIVAGAAISLQGAYKARHPGAFLQPRQLRSILTRTGTKPHADESRPIGRKPNLPAALQFLG